MTQNQLDLLTGESQYAITVLVDDLIDQSRRSDLFIKERTAQVFELNNLMRSIQNYSIANWSYLSPGDIELIQEKIVYLSEWRS